MKLHGSSYNYIIKYDNIDRAFFLPKNDTDIIYFIFGFKEPLK